MNDVLGKYNYGETVSRPAALGFYLILTGYRLHVSIPELLT